MKYSFFAPYLAIALISISKLIVLILMKFFKRSYLLSFVLLLVFQLHAKSFHNHYRAISIFSTFISDKSDVQFGFSNFVDCMDIEEVEFTDDDVLETEIKAISAINDTTTSFTFSGIQDIPNIIIAKITTTPIFYKSWQSYLQVFRL